MTNTPLPAASPTPRTDDWEARYGRARHWTSLARSLERELGEAKLDNERMADGSFNRGLKAGNDLSVQQQEAIHYWQTRAESAERRAEEAERCGSALREIVNMGGYGDTFSPRGGWDGWEQRHHEIIERLTNKGV